MRKVFTTPFGSLVTFLSPHCSGSQERDFTGCFNSGGNVQLEHQWDEKESVSLWLPPSSQASGQERKQTGPSRIPEWRLSWSTRDNGDQEELSQKFYRCHPWTLNKYWCFRGSCLVQCEKWYSLNSLKTRFLTVQFHLCKDSGSTNNPQWQRRQSVIARLWGEEG